MCEVIFFLNYFVFFENFINLPKYERSFFEEAKY